MKRILSEMLTVMLMSGAAQAATIEWGGASTITSDADVSTAGNMEYAYHAGGASVVLLNGVVFAAGGTDFDGDVALSGTPAIASIFGQNVAPFNTLSSAYQFLLDLGVYNNVGNKTQPVTVTLNNLTQGQQYEVQVWGNDSRNSSDRIMTVESGINTVSVDYNSTDALGGVGQYVLGTFTADTAMQDFTLTPNVALAFNAIQVRDVTPESPPIEWIGGAGSADWNNSNSWNSVHLPGSMESESVLFSGAEDSTALVSPFAFTNTSDIDVQAGAILSIQSDLSGVGAVVLGGEDGLAGGAVIQPNGTLSAESLTVTGYGELSFTLGESGVNAINVTNALVITSSSARLMVDASSYTGTATSIELVQCNSLNGSFDPVNIVITGLSSEQKPGGIVFDGDSLILQFGEVSTYQTELDTVLALGDLTNAPTLYTSNQVATTWAAVSAEIIATGEAQPIYYEGLDYNGHSTRIFAWVGLPADLSAPVPAVVLAHGSGSGTAYKTWVDLWNARGYAAIAMDFNGKTSDENGTASATPGGYRGPVQDGRYDNSVTYPSVALTNHWMYHCVADAVLANSLLRSMPEVNAEQVGMMGVSWGGTITSTTIGIDTRLAFAVPTYGCGHLYDSYSLYSHLTDCELYKQVWDPMVRIHRAALPVLWYSWPTDPHFPVDCQAATYLGAPGEHMVTLIPGMTHNHPAAWNREDSYTFADSIVSNGVPWCKQQSLALTGQVATVTFTSTRALDEAKLISTTGTGYAGGLTWNQTAATLVDNGDGSWTVTAALPADTTGWFINVQDDTLVVSSDYQEIINLTLDPSDQLSMSHTLGENKTTGTAQMAFTAPTNVEISDIRLNDQSHPGAFTNQTAAPMVRTDAFPATTPVVIEFNDTIAGLSDGESATATLTIIWDELDGTIDQIELAVRATADTYAGWTFSYSLVGDDALPGADSIDQDGYDNLAEYALGMNPTAADAGSRDWNNFSSEGGTNYFEYVHYRRLGYTEQDLNYLLIDTTNLVSSSFNTNAQDEVLVGPAVDGYEPVTNRYAADEPAQFIQLKIQQD